MGGCKLLRKHFSAQDQWYLQGFSKNTKILMLECLSNVSRPVDGGWMCGNGKPATGKWDALDCWWDKTYLKVLSCSMQQCSLNEPSDCVENSRLDLSHSSRSTLHWCPWQFDWTQTKPAVTNLVIFDNGQTTHACLLRLIQNLITKLVDARKM